MSTDESKLRISIETDQAVKATNKLDASLENVEKQGKETQDSFKGMGASGKALTAVVKKLAVGFGGLMVLKKVNAEARESVDLFYEQADAENILAASLGKNSDALLENASAWQEQTRYGDEAILRAQALVANFIKEEDQIKALTPAILNLATAKKMSLTSAADLVTKSVASSTNAMSRYGIEIEGAAGSAERAKSAIESLDKAFGGLAVADALTGKGAIEQAENKIGDLREEVGEKLAPAFEQAKKAQLQLYASILKSEAVVNTIEGIANGIYNAGLAIEWLAGGKRHSEMMSLVSDTERYEKKIKDLKDAMGELSVQTSYNADGTIMAGSAMDRYTRQVKELEKYRGEWLKQADKIKIKIKEIVNGTDEEAGATSTLTSKVKELTAAYEELESVAFTDIVRDSDIDDITGAYNALLYSVDEVAKAEAERAQVLGILDDAISSGIISTEQYDHVLKEWAKSNTTATEQVTESTKKISESTQTAIEGAISVTEDFSSTMAKHLKDGEADFASFALSAVNSIGQVIAKIITLQAVEAGASALANADGNAFGKSGVQPVQAFANGGVFNAPTAFSYGKGKLGVMGEAGPEAVMPLSRGSDGKLGVKVHGGGASGVNISVSNPISIQGNADSGTVQQLRALQKTIIKQTEESILSNIASGGKFSRAVNRRQ